MVITDDFSTHIFHNNEVSLNRSKFDENLSVNKVQTVHAE